MENPKNYLRTCLMVSLILIQHAAPAQQVHSKIITTPDGKGVIAERIAVGQTSEPPDYTTVTYSVPTEEIDHFSYAVMSVTNRGAGGGSTSDTEPDEFGIIHARVMRNPAVDRYFFLFATHRETGEQYFDLDLPPLRVSPVLGAIGLAKGRANNTRMVMPVFDVDADRDIIVQIRGERIAAEDVFDMIWEQTGCEITEEGKVLRVRNCLEPNDRGERP